MYQCTYLHCTALCVAFSVSLYVCRQGVHMHYNFFVTIAK